MSVCELLFGVPCFCLVFDVVVNVYVSLCCVVSCFFNLCFVMCVLCA